MDTQSINILFVANDTEDTQQLSRLLAGIGPIRFEVETVTSVQEALQCLENQRIDLVLLDLHLTDNQTLEPFMHVHNEFPRVPIVVLTAVEDENLALRLMQSGAQDYLVKGQFQGNTLVRSILYGIERQRLQVHLEQMNQQEQQERELRSLEQLSRASVSPVSARLFGMPALRESLPDIFNELVQHYGDLLDRALEQRMYKVEYNMSEELRLVAEQLGFLKAGPRDLVRIHSTALKRKAENAAPPKAQAYVEEGRLMILELMGYLVSYYRNFALGFSGRSSGMFQDRASSEEMGHE